MRALQVRIGAVRIGSRQGVEVAVRQEQLVLPAQSESVPAGRHFLAMMLEQWGLGELTDAVSLAASELLTNAVVHAGTAFQVTLRVDGQVCVEVTDTNPAWSPGSEPQPLPDWEAEGGRGLVLVQAVADAWGVRCEESGKTVWFRLALPEP